MHIIQLSDSHLSSAKPARAAELGACITHINALDPQPEVVVHTGDIAHDGLIEEYETARGLLDGLSAPYFVLAGNRDHRSNLIKVFAEGSPIQPDMRFVQYAVEDFPARLIMIDTLSTKSNKGQLCEARLEHVQHMLAHDASRPTVVFLHHPPFEVLVGPEPRNFEKWSEAEALTAEIQRHDHVHGIFCGHVHRSFETSIGSVQASVVSSMVSDLRWDEPKAAALGLPIFNAFDVPDRIESRT